MWLFLAFLAVPLLEIALFIQVGGLIGLFPTLAIVVITAIIGTWLVRAQGRLAMGNLRRSFSELDDPTEPLAHAAMILVAGAMLLTPGFFTDGVGFALLMPPVRRAAFGFLRRRVNVQTFEMGSDEYARRQRGPAQTDDSDIVEGEYHEIHGPDIPPSKRPTHRPSGWTRH